MDPFVFSDGTQLTRCCYTSYVPRTHWTKQVWGVLCREMAQWQTPCSVFRPLPRADFQFRNAIGTATDFYFTVLSTLPCCPPARVIIMQHAKKMRANSQPFNQF
jgi:hypothetical protein